jgi:hypothetical protein
MNFFSGAYPVSKLKINDPSFPVFATLYAFSELHMGNSEASGTPAVTFAMKVENPTQTPVNISFLMNLPFVCDEDTSRYPPTPEERSAFAQIEAKDVISCMKACYSLDECAVWNFDESSSQCALFLDPTYSVYYYGIKSGVKGYWSSNENMLTLNKKTGVNPTSGNLTITAPGL